MTIAVNTPDGGVANFPDGTPTNTITSAMRAKFGGPDSAAAPSASGSGWGSFLTSPQFMNESYAQEAKDLALSGGDYALLGQGKRLAPSLADAIQQAHQNLGYADYGVGAAAYALGPGKILKPLAAGLGGGIATEGALAGGISGFDPNAPVSSTLEGAGGGAALGYGAGKLGNIAGNVVGGLAAKAGKGIDPAAATTTLKGLRDQAYAPLQGIAYNPNDVLGAHTSATLTPGMMADVTPGMDSMLAKQRQAIQNGGNTANDIADYVTNLREVSGKPTSSNGDKLLAGQTASNLEGLLQTGKPITGQTPSEAWNTLQNARQVHQQYMSAQALEEYANNLNTFGVSPGSDPMKQAQFYNPNTQGANIKGWADLYKAGAQHQGGLSYLMGKAGGEGAEALAAGMGAGGPITMAAGLAGHVLKYPIQGLQNAYKRTALRNAIQQQYPGQVGLQQGVTPYGSNVGDAIKALTLSQGSQWGY